MSAEGERGRRGASRQGNIISHEPASDNSTVQNVLGFIQDYVPQAVTGSKGEKKERVLWTHFQRADLNDVRRWGGVEGRGGGGREDALVLTLGVSTGFSVWLIPPGGDAREVYCCYGDGETARTVHLLATPDPNRGRAGGIEDQFSSQRPIIAVVKKGRSGGVGVPYSTLQLLSLTATNTDSLIKKLQFKSRPILGIHSNRRVIAVVFKKRVLVIDAASFATRFYIKNDYPLDHIVNPVSLGHRWLAVTETKLSAKYRSCGGVSQSQPHSVATTVIKNVKKGLTALSDTLSGLTSGKVQSSIEPSDSPPQSADHSTANVITVLDINYNHSEEVRLHEAGRVAGGVVAHFLATTERGTHIAALAFNPSGSLLVTAGTDGHSFNVFHLLPHPWLSTEAAVHHTYTLFRGATSASVQDISVSWDSRWVAVSTLNGTSHLFPTSPYGGEVNVRTHITRRVVNKLSRFHTSAGIETVAPQSHAHTTTPPPSISTSSSSSSSSSSLHPSHSPPSCEAATLNSPPNPITWNNPRGPPHPVPVIVKALHQIKQPYLTTDDGSMLPGSVSGGAGPSPSLSGGESGSPWLGGPGENQCVCTFFTPSPHQNGDRNSTDSASGFAMYTLFVLGGSGTLTQYSMQPHPHEDAREGDDAPISLDCHGQHSWRLLSKPHPPTMKLPLSEDNPLISTANEQRTVTKKERERRESGGAGEGEWLSQVELVTHATPTRRLWMGPQFSFKTYNSHITAPATSTGQSGSVVPATSNLISLSPDPAHQRPLSAESGESAVLSPSHDTLLSDLFQQPPELTSLHTSPIPMPTRPGSQPREHGMESGSHSMERGVVEVYGSWNKMAPQLEASQTVDVAERLAEAMGDHTLSPPLTEPQVTIATAQRSGHAKTGFETASDPPLYP